MMSIFSPCRKMKSFMVENWFWRVIRIWRRRGRLPSIISGWEGLWEGVEGVVHFMQCSAITCLFLFGLVVCMSGHSTTIFSSLFFHSFTQKATPTQVSMPIISLSSQKFHGSATQCHVCFLFSDIHYHFKQFIIKVGVKYVYYHWAIIHKMSYSEFEFVSGNLSGWNWNGLGL